VSPQSSSACVMAQPVSQEQEDKLIYDMDSKSTRNQVGPSGKRKRHISIEETQDAIISILPKKKKEEEEEGDDLNDSGFQEENEMFHPAFRGHTPNNGMEVEQITSLVSIFSFGQQLFNNADTSNQSSSPNKKTKEDEDSDSDSDTSSDSGHSSDDHENNADDKPEEGADEGLNIPNNIRVTSGDLRCSSQVKEGDHEAATAGVAAAV